MSRRPFFRLAAGLAVASLSLMPLPVQAGGGCGCEGPSSTVYHVHQRCGHHCRHSCAPPAGIIVPSAPMMAAPMMPMMAAPMMMPAQMMPVAAPTMTMAPMQTVSLAPVAAPQATLQFSLAAPQASTCAGSSLTSDQLRTLQSLLTNGQTNGSSALASPSRTTDDLAERVAKLETDVQELKTSVREIVDILKVIKDR